MTLVKILPHLVGNYILEDDDHWSCFLTLWDICNGTGFQVLAK